MKSLERQLRTSLAVIMSLILFGLVLVAHLSTRTILEDFVTSRLNHDAERLLDSLEISPESFKLRWRRINPSYNAANSGHYYSIRVHNDGVDERLLSSHSLQGGVIPTPLSELPSVLHDITGPQDQHLIVWTTTRSISGQNVTVSVAEDMSLLMKKRRYFFVVFVSIGLVGFILIVILQRIAIRRLFILLDDSRQEIRQIESGERQQLSEQVPSEIFPLVSEFNHSLSLMQQRMERSRNSLGNLAHALKTPLSLLIQQLDKLTSGLDKKDKQNMMLAKAQVERIHQLTERELKRARMAGQGNTNQRFDPNEELPTLIDVLKKAHQKNELKVTLTVAKTVKVFGDREDMLELIGNLLDNAYKWANSQVSCKVLLSEEKTRTEIIIEDDGIGKEAGELDKIIQRGTRLDESIQGHGLGLAICRDIVQLYAGNIHLARSENLGGFKVEVHLPFLTV